MRNIIDKATGEIFEKTECEESNSELYFEMLQRTLPELILRQEVST